MARLCVSSYTQIGKMRNQRVLRFLLLYNILETVYRVAHATDGRTQGFLQTDGALSHFTEEGFQFPEYIKPEDASAVSFANLDEENLNTYASPVSFLPAMLDFFNRPVGMPHLERVTVKNLSPDTSIHMLSISGNTLHFHCSFFKEKVIPPGGNTSFEVVFLARQEGLVENTLFIHTSLGSFKYQVIALGIPNPYRLRPLIGVRMPLNSSYTPVVLMHNPHSSTLQLTEMYTSGGDLHLELPDGEGEAPKNIWEIPPYETKPVIKANFIARVEKNHTAFIRIRTNETDSDYLVLPVEVDVTSVPGIYSPIETLDFGILRSHDPPKSLSLSLLNSGQKHIHIVNVIVTPVNEAVDVKFIPIKVPPDTVFSTQVATITFNPAKVFHMKQCCGKIVVKSKNNQYKLHVPYQVYLIKGSLDFNKSSTRFYVGEDIKSTRIDIRDLNITNNFNVTVIIYNLSLPEEAKPHFKVNFKEPVVLMPGETLSAAWLTFQPAHKNLQLTTYLRLHTNISYFDVPLLCFSGRLKVFLPHAINESFIDFGTLGMGDKRTMIFAVINENPVDVNLKLWGSNITKTYVELVGVHKGNASTLAWRHNFSALVHSLVLKPQHYAIFRIGITAPSYEGILNGHAFVETQYGKITMPFSLRTAKGSLKVDDIYFGNIFPGKISTLNFYVHSSFSHSMTVTGVTAIPEDKRFSFDPLKHAPPVLYPNSRNMVGKVHCDLRKQCLQKCYSGLPTTTSMGHQWLLGMSLPPDVADMDRELFKTLHNRWKKLIELEGKSVNMTLNLDTTEVRSHILKAAAVLHWPRLFNKPYVKFPVTQIGNHTVKDFTLENPSSLPLIVQMVPLSIYPKPQEVVNLLVDRLGGKLLNLKHVTSDPDIFTLEDLEENNKSPENHIPTYRKSIEEYFGVQSHKQSIAILLTPGMRVRIHVGFTPKDELFRSSLILIRNNLTVLDAFLVQGQGGHGEIKFGNISPGSDSALNFELTDKHLKDCDGTRSKFSTPNFTVRKPFTARNTGALPLYVRGFDINGKPCEAYGFRVLNCEGFELNPNESRRVDIAFTPDFTLTHIERVLNIHTSQGPTGQILQFTLLATVPRHMLAYCSETLPRPFWELFVYYTFNLMTSMLIFGLLVFAHFDSQKILRSSYFPVATIGIHSDKVEKGNIFDLNALACHNSDSNSTLKVINCRPSDTKRQKDPSAEKTTATENFIPPLLSSSSSSSSSSSHKKNNSSIIKHKDMSHVKDFDENFCENGIRHSRRKTTKLKQPQENYILEPEFVEIKKSQPRNSWTRFLKPPFSFNTNSQNVNKPSVATQTSNEENESSTARDMDVSIEQELENTSNNSENNLKNKAKVKKDAESKMQSKKNGDSLPEEETSSTTTETSTTESDISEKDHHLPDVCVTAKVLKNRFTKNKLREKGEQCNKISDVKPVNSSVSEADDFELSSKSRGHKKIKVDPSKVFGGDILRPSTLELPYKPKPVSGDQKKEEEFLSDDSRLSFKALSNSSLKSKVSDSTFTQPEDNFAFPQGIRRNLWQPNSSLENTAHISGRQNTYSSNPTSYSAVLSRDISTKSTEKSISNITNSVNNFNKSAVGQRLPALVRTSSHCNYLGHCTSPTNAFNSSAPLSAQYSCSRVPDDFSASKLKHWVAHSNPDCLMSSATAADLLRSVKEDDIYCRRRQSTSNSCYPLCSNLDSIWGSQPAAVMQAIQSEKRHRIESHKKQHSAYNDWPGFDSELPIDFWSGEKDVNSDLAAQGSKFTSGVWNSSVSSNSSCWDNISKLWSSPSSEDSIVSPVGNSVSINEHATSSVTDSQNPNTSSSEFHPFHSLNSLWISNLTPQPETSAEPAASNNTWSFSLFSEPASPALSEESSQVQESKEDEDNEPLTEPNQETTN